MIVQNNIDSVQKRQMYQQNIENFNTIKSNTSLVTLKVIEDKENDV